MVDKLLICKTLLVTSIPSAIGFALVGMHGILHLGDRDPSFYEDVGNNVSVMMLTIMYAVPLTFVGFCFGGDDRKPPLKLSIKYVLIAVFFVIGASFYAVYDNTAYLGGERVTIFLI